MKQYGYNQKEQWCAESFERLKKPMTQMIRKNYLDYQPDDYVLWIVPDIFCKYEVEQVVGQIQIMDREHRELKQNCMIRQPYPNKGIYQISMKSGRKRLYGVPLVFRTFEELEKVKYIQIRWDIYYRTYLDDRPFDLTLANHIVDYELTFQKPENDNRFFTVYSKESMEVNPSSFMLDEFDDVIWSGGTIVLGDIIESQLIDFNDIYDVARESTDEEYDFLHTMEQEEKPVSLLLKYEPMYREIQWDVYWYRKKACLAAAEVADILPEPCFGFESS